MLLNPLDREALRQEFRSAKPYPHIVIENFLQEDFLREVVGSYPNFSQAWEEAKGTRDAFVALNERYKLQVTDSNRFPEPVRRLHEALASQAFLDDLSYITGIPNLLADPEMRGGGMHMTGPRGRLDVHIDFNYDKKAKLHRRLNILLYLNDDWKETWGGAVELWDRDVKHCVRSLPPTLNRCMIFETSEISYHGVEPVTCPEGVARKSFAGYYYTREAPENWDGTIHSTNFKPRPNEYLRNAVLGRFESMGRRMYYRYRQAERLIKRIGGVGG